MIEGSEARPLGAPYYDALLAHAADLVAGGKRPSKLSKRWRLLPLALSDAQAGFFYQQFGDQLLNKSPSAEIVAALLDLFGEAVLTKTGINSRTSQTLRVVLDPLLASSDPNALSVVERNSVAFGAMVSQASEADLEVLKTRFEALLKTADEPTTARYLRLAE